MMKKITLALIGIFSLITFISFGQTYTTGLVQLSNTAGSEYSMQLDVTTTEVTLTMIGPSDRWLGLGFDAVSMTSGKDVVIYDGTDLTDRAFVGIGVIPPLDDRQDWTVTSNTVTSSVRTLIATRDLDTGNPGDYVFSAAAASISLVWARGNNGFVLGYHGGSNRGITIQSFVLSLTEAQLSEYRISPNPAKNSLNITLPNGFENVKLEVFDVLGKNIYSQKLNDLTSLIDISKWNTGIYLIRISSDKETQTKRFIKQ